MWHRPNPRRWGRCAAWTVVLIWLLCARTASAEDAGREQALPRGPSLEDRLRQLERDYVAIAERNEELSRDLEALRSSVDSTDRMPRESEALPALSASDEQPCVVPSSESDHPWFLAGYDEGFVIVPADPDESPFSLKFNNQNMFRYAGFARDVRTWTDSAGVVSPVTNRSNFEIPRGRLIFSGDALLPGLGYLVNIDYNTISTQPIGFRAYWLSYRFDDGTTIHVGQNKVPGSREWLTSSGLVLGPDRSLATTFFRPSLSQGIWFTGEPRENLYYYAGMFNGFNTLNTPPDQLDSRFCWSGSIWWEPWGEFGDTYSDVEGHYEPVVRCGTSLTYSTEQGQQGNPNAPENAEIRLSDGTVITDPGAFAPGVTLQRYQIGLAAFDLAFKYQGWSLSAEFYLQDLFGLQGDGPLPLGSTFAFGGFAQAGYFVIPHQCEIYARTSQVSGRYGTGGEYAGGFNWYFLPGKSNLRFTLDGAWINHSPADQNRTDYRAGDTGILLRTQIQTRF